MALVSPGVEVSVIDESFYTPASAGTIPMIFVVTAENKSNASGTGVAQGTLKSNAGRPYLVTSQRELGELFGDALFYSDNNGNMIHGSELNEYGLQTAYSLLGVTNRVYVSRADLNISELEASATAPSGEPTNGQYWLDTQTSIFGLLEWNGEPLTTTGGQSFTSIEPIVITDENDITSSGPKGSIGAVGDYAIDTTTTLNEVWYKSAGNTNAVDGPAAGEWVQVGSDDWKNSWPTIAGETVTGAPAISDLDLEINGTTVALVGASISLSDVVTAINNAGIAGVSAKLESSAINIYVDTEAASDGATKDGVIELSANDVSMLGELGLEAGTFNSPALAVQPHTSVPQWKLTGVDQTTRPTGSVWLKTTSPNGGANISIKRYSSETQLWSRVFTPIYTSSEAAIFNLDRSGGGSSLQIGDVFIKANVDGDANPATIVDSGSALANYTAYVRETAGATRVVGVNKISASTITAGAATFDLYETTVNSATFGNAVTISFTAVGDSTDAETIASAVNAGGLTNVSAEVDNNNRIVLVHKLGGEIKIDDSDGVLVEAGFAPFDPDASGTQATNLYYAPGSGSGVNPELMIASNWTPLTYTASDDEPSTLTEDGALWYNSVVDEVDILVHNGIDWVGYRTEFSNTDVNGPIVSASEPTEQSDGNSLQEGDIWVSTASIENYPLIYRFNSQNDWEQLDKSDQTSENGVLFADARWSTNGGTLESIEQADIADLLLSNYKDPDAPDPALYPRGMLLWNTRRSGFNVKRFERNYINTAEDNERFPVITVGGEDSYNTASGDAQSMESYYPHRWVTDSGNNEDGSGTFGRQAQRKSVVQSLQSLLNSNQEIRDEESRFFNLIATPGYPELIGEMISLNYDRRLSAFVVGDTPARLTPDATSLNEWAANVRNAVEDNDDGAVSRDEYLAMYYPWGFTSDNAGNNVVVPPSHMALRTLVLNDQVAYPWFAPAGTRRGGVTNATATGYINSEGEFISISLNTGQRDTLYSNNINPITFIGGAGLVVFGQKTRARNASALDRINVARLVVYMRVQLERLARPYLFEPNDSITRSQIKSAADSFLLELVGLRGVYDFLTVCDTSNNTPARIDRNELWLDVAIEPVKAVEFIYIPLRIKNTGEIAGL